MIEQAIERSIASGQNEKTFIDKLLAKDDVNALRNLVKKARLTREELLEILYLLTSAESKLVNYGKWERYVILKYFVWIREFVKIAEMLHDYKEDRQKRIDEDFGHSLGPAACEYKNAKGVTCDAIHTWLLVEDKETTNLIDNNLRSMEHNIKFLVDLYLNIARTSLSLGGSGFFEMMKNKFEMAYSGLTGQKPDLPSQVPQR